MGGYAPLKAHAFFEDIDWDNLHLQKAPELLPYLPAKGEDTEYWSQYKVSDLPWCFEPLILKRRRCMNESLRGHLCHLLYTPPPPLSTTPSLGNFCLFGILYFLHLSSNFVFIQKLTGLLLSIFICEGTKCATLICVCICYFRQVWMTSTCRTL